MNDGIAAKGRKRPLKNIPIERLHLDNFNPRLPESIQGKPENEVIVALLKYFNLEELVDSLSENGYFDEEPLVAIPIDLPSEFSGLSYEELKNNANYHDFIGSEKTHFIVVEGNRRLSSVKLLMDDFLRAELKLKTWPDINEEVRSDLKSLPTIIYPTRKEVLPYLGVRHITGIKKWEPFAKARYIAYMVKEGNSLADIQRMVGDKKNSSRKFYLCYKILEEIENEFDINTDVAKDSFSYLLLATGQGNIKIFLGLPVKLDHVDFEHPIQREKLQNLKKFYIWLFGDNEGKGKVIEESRDITDYLSEVVSDEKAIKHLSETGDLKAAYERSGGEERLLLSYLATANSNLDKSLGFIIRNKTDEVREEVDKCNASISAIYKLLKE